MATATAPRTKVETSQGTEVVVDKNLIRLVQSWKKIDNDSGLGWMHIAKYVIDNEEISSKQIQKALVDIRGLKPNSAKSEASRFLRIRKSEEAQDMLDRALGGDKSITVYDLRSTAVKRGEKVEVDEQDQLDKKLKSAARFSIKNGLVDDKKEFATAAMNAFAVVESELAKAEAAGEEEPAEAEDESEGDE
jgi:hypothetical protein